MVISAALHKLGSPVSDDAATLNEPKDNIPQHPQRRMRAHSGRNMRSVWPFHLRLQQDYTDFICTQVLVCDKRKTVFVIFTVSQPGQDLNLIRPIGV